MAQLTPSDAFEKKFHMLYIYITTAIFVIYRPRSCVHRQQSMYKIFRFVSVTFFRLFEILIFQTLILTETVLPISFCSNKSITLVLYCS